MEFPEVYELVDEVTGAVVFKGTLCEAEEYLNRLPDVVRLPGRMAEDSPEEE